MFPCEIELYTHIYIIHVKPASARGKSRNKTAQNIAVMLQSDPRIDLKVSFIIGVVDTQDLEAPTTESASHFSNDENV